jgi:hypothetical protein
MAFDVDLSAAITDRAMLESVDWDAVVNAAMSCVAEADLDAEYVSPGWGYDRFVCDEFGYPTFGADGVSCILTVEHVMEVQRAVWRRRAAGEAR